MPEKDLQVAKVSEEGKKNNSIRSASVCTLPAVQDNEWIFSKLEDILVDCNKKYYQMDIIGFYEAIQLIKYNPEDHYDWHMDFANKHHSNRKLSLSIQLTDPSEYEGGDLEFFKNGNGPKEQGTLILFPSFLYHKVHPITSGVRRALVGWISGNPYR